jgi:hypothetical protein
MNQFRHGTYTGAGAAKNIELGFSPDFVILFNVTDGTPVALWGAGMAAGTAIDIAAASASNPDNGISAYAGDATHAPGFTAGTDYAANAKVYHYFAFRSAGPKTQPAAVNTTSAST